MGPGKCDPGAHLPRGLRPLRPAGGPLRTTQMLVEGRPDAVIAFPGGKGTAHMVRKARAAGLPVVEARI